MDLYVIDERENDRIWQNRVLALQVIADFIDMGGDLRPLEAAQNAGIISSGPFNARHLKNLRCRSGKREHRVVGALLCSNGRKG